MQRPPRHPQRARRLVSQSHHKLFGFRLQMAAQERMVGSRILAFSYGYMGSLQCVFCSSARFHG